MRGGGLKVTEGAARAAVGAAGGKHISILLRLRAVGV